MNYMKKLGSLVGLAGFGLTIAFSACAMDSATSSSIVNESALNSRDKAVLHELMPAWKDFYSTNNWKELIRTIQPLESGCGIIYELPKNASIFLKQDLLCGRPSLTRPCSLDTYPVT